MRKEPRQARSRATVEAIVEAGARVLARHGWNGFTTNETARIAGVSIGSLYQYFPNNLALVEAIRRRHFDDVLTVMRAATGGKTTPMRRIETLVRGMINVHGAHPALHRVLLEEAPYGGGSNTAHEQFEAEYRSSYEALVRLHQPGGTGEVGEAARVLSAAIEGVVHDAARRGALHSPTLNEELIALVQAFLRGRRSVGR
jgi:AcrR family transcriptional regulator